MRWYSIIRTISLACLLVLLALASAIVADGLIDNVQSSDVAIVLGSQVMPDGGPSPRLRARLGRRLITSEPNSDGGELYSG